MRLFTRLGIAAALGAGIVAVPLAATAAPRTTGIDTFTRVTTPSKDTLVQLKPGVTNSITVAGTTSSDVTAVNIVCVTHHYGGPSDVTEFASSVAVVSSKFTVTAIYPSENSAPAPCQLLAVPTDVDATTDYLGSFSGPLLRSDSLSISSFSPPTTPYGYNAYAEEGTGVGVLTDAGQCTFGALTTLALPQDELSAVEFECAFALPPENAGGAATKSSLAVDGHNAYLPSGVHQLLFSSLSLPVTHTKLTVTRQVAANGDVTITESAPIVRCKVSDLYPPTPTSCPSLVSTGVTFQRVSTFFRGGHQLKFRDTFTSTNHAAHTLSLLYQNEVGNADSTRAGFIVPGHTTTFHGATLGQSFTGLGTKAATVLVRSNLYSSATSPSDDTLAQTWSRAPSRLTFDSTQRDKYSLAYSLKVPASGVARIGFALSESPSTTSASSLAALAVKDMIAAPTITSPKNNATVKTTKTTVSGSLTAGANGLPTAVTVNGHKATITVKSATSATYTVTFTETAGTHALKATATDSAGNTAVSSTVTVHNG